MRVFQLATIACVLSATQLGAQARTNPCITLSAECERWVTLGGGPGRAMAYSTYALDKLNRNVTRAFILVHGTGRNADH
jgi:hypothetical protein